jgi:hypothetical protein
MRIAEAKQTTEAVLKHPVGGGRQLGIFNPGVDPAGTAGFCRPRPDRQPPDDCGLITLLGRR